VSSGFPKLEGPIRLIRASLGDFVSNWRAYAVILAVVAVPFNILALLQFSSTDIQMLSSYSALATVVMNVALIWAIIESEKGGEPTLARAYYTGVGQIVSYILTTALLVLMLVPLALGLTLFTSVTAPDVGTTTPEILLVGGLALVIALPSLYLVVRFGFALLLVMTDNLRPFAALRRAWQLTRRNFWRVTGRLLLLIIFLLVLSIPAAAITVGVSLLKQENLAIALFQIMSTLTILPIAYLYALRLLRGLQNR
jgi:hypothetical protein